MLVAPNKQFILSHLRMPATKVLDSLRSNPLEYVSGWASFTPTFTKMDFPGSISPVSVASMELGSCPIDSLLCLKHGSSLAFSCCVWRVHMCIWLALASNIDQWGHLVSIVGLPDKSSPLSVHLAIFIEWKSRGVVLHGFSVSRTMLLSIWGVPSLLPSVVMCVSHVAVCLRCLLIHYRGMVVFHGCCIPLSLSVIEELPVYCHL